MLQYSIESNACPAGNLRCLGQRDFPSKDLLEAWALFALEYAIKNNRVLVRTVEAFTEGDIFYAEPSTS
jgi:hypothetical protein